MAKETREEPLQKHRLTPLFFSRLPMLFLLEVELLDWRQGPEHSCWCHGTSPVVERVPQRSPKKQFDEWSLHLWRAEVSQATYFLLFAFFFFNCNLHCLFFSIQTSFRPRTPPFLCPFLFLVPQLSNRTLCVSANSLPRPSNFIFQLFAVVLGYVQFRKGPRI